MQREKRGTVHITRQEIAAQYTSVNRADQGLGLIFDLLKDNNLMDDTLIMFFSDNGIPFESGKTNVYERGVGEPLIISNPQFSGGGGSSPHVTTGVSSLDFVPTILDWTGVKWTNYTLNKAIVYLTGRSLLPVFEEDSTKGIIFVFSFFFFF